MENLPNDVLSKIFIRLLARQLAQMRCISKSWNALLSESTFIKSHLHHSIHNNEETFLFFHKGFSFDHNSITTRSSRSPNLELTDFLKHHLRSCDNYNRSKVIGSVNGLICFSYGSFSLPSRDYGVYIWNPSLSVVLTLPPCSLPSDDSMENHFRFEFDLKTDDYKVVKLTSLVEPPNMLPQVEIYSLRKGSWELIPQRFPSHIEMLSHDDGACINGHIYWVGNTYLNRKTQTQTQMIVVFDLGSETFSEIPLPDSIIDYNWYHSTGLGVLAGKLCVVSINCDDECEMWVMDEYGVAESWVKHHAFSKLSNYDIVPYVFTSHNQFLFQVNIIHASFAMYDPITTKTKPFKKLNSIYLVTKVVEYVDSLVWVEHAKHEMRFCCISRFQF